MKRTPRLSLALSVILMTSCLLACDQLGFPGSGGADPESAEGGEDGDEVSDSADDRDFEAEEGSCNDWKISYCEAVEQCTGQTHEECELDVGFVRCAEEAPFSECIGHIESALSDDDCDEIPMECYPDQIADRTVPTEVCRDIYYAMCEGDYICLNTVSIESCTASLEIGTPCNRFTAVLPRAEDCLEALSIRACGDAIPELCFQVFRY